MRTSVVAKPEFGETETFSRLDAEFINAPIRAVEQALEAFPGMRLAAHVKDRIPAIRKSSHADGTEWYIDITSVDNADGLTFPEQIRTQDLPSRAKYRVRDGDILVSNVRPNRGAVSLLSERNDGHIASSGFTLLRTNSDAAVSPEYLFSFLKSSFGRQQLVRRNRGSMYPAVTADDVQDVWVPSPDSRTEATIQKHVRAGLSFQDEFYRIHGEATDVLNEFLKPYGAPPSPLESNRHGVNSHLITSRDVFGEESALRFDAEFFREEYREFDEHLRDLGPSFLLGERYHLSVGSALSRGGGTTPYMKQGCLTNVGINWSAVGAEPGRISKGSPRIAPGDILLACTAHEIYYVGRKVDLVREVPAPLKGVTTCVADLMVLRSLPAHPGQRFGSYVAAFLRHPAGLHQVQRCIRGLRGGHVYKSDLAKYVRVPIPLDDWLTRFESLGEAAENSRRSAKLEMENAFAAVTKYVEGLV